MTHTNGGEGLLVARRLQTGGDEGLTSWSQGCSCWGVMNFLFCRHCNVSKMPCAAASIATARSSGLDACTKRSVIPLSRSQGRDSVASKIRYLPPCLLAAQAPTHDLLDVNLPITSSLAIHSLHCSCIANKKPFSVPTLGLPRHLHDYLYDHCMTISQILTIIPAGLSSLALHSS